MNQLSVCVCVCVCMCVCACVRAPLPFEPTPPDPSRLSQSAELSSLCYTAAPTSFLFSTWCIYVKPHLPVHPTLPFPLCPHIRSLRLRLCSCPETRFICTFFYIPHTCFNIQYLFFLFLTSFTLYDRL